MGNKKRQSLHHQRREAQRKAERQRPDAGQIRSRIMALLTARGPDRSARPMDVAKELDPDQWRQHLKAIREEAIGLAREGKIEILRKGKRVEPDNVRGVIRLRIIPPEFREVLEE
jgi:hypothetical protein